MTFPPSCATEFTIKAYNNPNQRLQTIIEPIPAKFKDVARELIADGKSPDLVKGEMTLIPSTSKGNGRRFHTQFDL